MKKLNLHVNNDISYITVPVDFIDLYMPEAPSVALKVYLYLLRASSDPSILLSVQDMTDLFDVTQNKIVQALRYWDSCGLLALQEHDGEITDITLLPLSKGEVSSSAPVLPDPADTEVPAALPSQKRPAETPAIDLNTLFRDEGFTEILSLAEFYTKKSLSSTQQNALASCYVLLGRQTDIVEYLIENCIDNGHSSFHYMEAVARRWHEEGYETLEDIKAASAFRNEAVYKTLKALGIKRDPVASEESMILEWAKQFDLPIVLEACTRTMQNLHMADFKYVNAILNRWKDAGVRSLEDIAALDVQHEDQKKEKKSRPAAAGFKNSETRGTDYDQLFSNYYRK